MGGSEKIEGPEEIRSMVREAYGQRARAAQGPCACGTDARGHAEEIGYEAAEIESVPEGANLGLGCGNPTAIASLRPGEVVLDLGSGAGFDAFLAAQAVGPTGRVIGVDMTPAMLEKARTHAVTAGVAGRVEFREGIIEALPVVSESVDVVISNCVINLSPDKPQAFREAFRVLKRGGRLAVSDLVLSAPLPPAIAELAGAWAACIGGTMLEKDYLAAIDAAGFEAIETSRTSVAPMLEAFRGDPMVNAAIDSLGSEVVAKAAASVWSLKVQAKKPIR